MSNAVEGETSAASEASGTESSPRSYFAANANAPVPGLALGATGADSSAGADTTAAAPAVVAALPSPIDPVSDGLPAPAVVETPAAESVVAAVETVEQAEAQPDVTMAAAAGMPKVQAFTLPEADLHRIASDAGLQWVGSDADKVAAVQAAIAAEPKPVHIPRERPPMVVLDEGPLILVETRRDLAGMVLPFETETGQVSDAAQA